MESFPITHYSFYNSFAFQNEVEDAYYYASRCYSMQHLIDGGITSPGNILEALQKAMKVCELAGIDSTRHFKKIFVCDVATQTTFTDWLMTKKGFNLILIEYPVLNEKLAQFLLNLVE